MDVENEKVRLETLANSDGFCCGSDGGHDIILLVMPGQFPGDQVTHEGVIIHNRDAWPVCERIGWRNDL